MPRLIKSVTTTYIPGDPGITAVPSSPAKAAYWAVEAVTSCSPRMVPDPLGPSSSSYNLVTTCETTNINVYHPAQAATNGTAGVSPTPEQIRISLNSGWNSYASTIGALAAGAYFKFTVKPGSEGALLGVASPGAEGRPIETFPLGIMVDVSGIHVFESGVKIATLGANTPGTEVRIARLADGRIVYATSAGVFRISTTTPRPSSDALVVYGLLYSGYDEVSSSSFVTGNLLSEPACSLIGSGALSGRADRFITATMSGAGSLLAVAATTAALSGSGSLAASTAATQSASLLGAGTLTATATREQLVEAQLSGKGALLGESRVGARGYATLLPLQGLGGSTAYGVGRGDLPYFTSVAAQTAYIPPAATRGYANLPFITAWAHGVSLDKGQASATLAPLVSLAGGYPYGFGYGELPQFYSAAYGGFVAKDMLVLVSSVVGDMPFAPNRDLVMFLTSSGALQSVQTLTREQALQLLSALQTQSTFTLKGVYGYTLLSGMSGISLQTLSANGRPDLHDTGVVWVVNAETKASSQYESYGFNSFIKRNGVVYGVAADGIYRLDSTDDAGLPIAALAYLGRLDFGTAAKKQLPNVYLGVASESLMKLDVNADGTTYNYEARSSEAATIKNHRVDLGRGLKANTLGLTVKNKDGADFELATVELLQAPTTRRI